MKPLVEVKWLFRRWYVFAFTIANTAGVAAIISPDRMDPAGPEVDRPGPDQRQHGAGTCSTSLGPAGPTSPGSSRRRAPGSEPETKEATQP